MKKSHRSPVRASKNTRPRQDGHRQFGASAKTRERTLQALERSEERYRHLVENSLGLICTHDLAGTILSVNQAAAQSLGYSPKDGPGRNLKDFLAPETRDLFDEYLARVQKNKSDAGLMRVRAKDGTHRIWMYRNILYQES